MTPWLEVCLAVLLSLASAALALRVRVARWWWVALGVAGVAAALVLANQIPRRMNGYLLSAAVPLIATPLLNFELTRLTRWGLILATLMATAYSGWLEFLGPALAHAELSTLQTRLTNDGVCLQSTDYTCGPASAVTALVRLGFPAEEGDLALRANCSSHTGTDPSDLARAIQDRFGANGARSEYRPLNTMEELKQAGLALTVIQFNTLVDHWVTVLRVDTKNVHFADPLSGLRMLPIAEFELKWEHETIRVWRIASP